MRQLRLTLLALLWGFALLGAISWQVRNQDPHPYVDQPIDGLNYWIGYYPDSLHEKGNHKGTILLEGSTLNLGKYEDRTSHQVLPACSLANMKLTFAFNHFAQGSKNLNEPWRIANEGGALLGTRIPIYLTHVMGEVEYGPYYASSQAPHQFEFHCPFNQFPEALLPGVYELTLAIEEADIPLIKRKKVAKLFSPSYYPRYSLRIEVPENC